MTALILDGRATRQALMLELTKKFQALPFVPTLAIIQVGDRPDSTSFIRAKRLFAAKLGVKEKHIHVSENISQAELIDIIKECNSDREIRGIIVQLPLPVAIDRDQVIDTIDPGKDVDALTAFSVKRWLEGREDALMPATARGIRQLLEFYKISLFGRKVTVIGRSMLVGKPITAMCLNENSSVTVCHSKTRELMKETRSSDVIIVAAGKPGLINGKFVKKGQIVIDVGINTISGAKLDEEIENTTLVGDVDFQKVSKKVAAITPVPGGVGPMTVLALFENLYDLCKN